MKSCKIMAVRAGVLSIAVLVGADRKAKTEDGKEVILHDDGTWVFADVVKKDKKEGKEAKKEFKKPVNAKLQYTEKRGTLALYLVPEKSGKRWRIRLPLPRRSVSAIRTATCTRW